MQSGDSVNDNFLGHMDLVRLSNGDLLNCTCRDEWGSYEKCRFVRISPTGDPVQQREVDMAQDGAPDQRQHHRAIRRSGAWREGNEVRFGMNAMAIGGEVVRVGDLVNA